jgi:hypothetical protein
VAGYNSYVHLVHRPTVFDDNHVVKNPIPVEQALHGFDRVAPASIDTPLSQLGCGPPGASKTSYWPNESRQFPLSKWQAAVPRLRRAPCSLFLEQNAFNHCDGRHNSRESSVDIPTSERKMQMPLRLTIATPLLDIETKWMPSGLFAEIERLARIFAEPDATAERSRPRSCELAAQRNTRA